VIVGRLRGIRRGIWPGPASVGAGKVAQQDAPVLRMVAEFPVDLDPQQELDQIRRERDLYLRLLELGALTEIESFLGESLKLVVELTGAQSGYLELRDPRDTDENAGWYLSHGFTAPETEDVRSRISRGIVAQVLATGQTIDTPSAILDPRFSDRGSVQAMRIEAVLCVPIGQDPPLGALYLQGRHRPGPFAELERRRAEIFCHHLTRLADSLILRLKVEGEPNPTEALRRTLRLDGIVGRSAALAALFSELRLVAPLDVSVLLTGACGTGKSLIARVVHDNSPRASQPFVELSCANLPEALIENELFGSVSGAHSTATTRLLGKVAAAEHGTLFLDEVGELSASAQAKLLQLLQSKTYYPLGANKVAHADVRLIAATNADLEAAVASGRFRQDLFYRLQVMPLRVPSLKERRGDVSELARFFCARACERHKLAHVELAASALRSLEASEWPGNVRQLENAIEAACIRAAGEGVLWVEHRHVFRDDRERTDPETDAAPSLQEATRTFQRELLGRVLDECGWNVAAAARRLDIARSHAYTLIKAFGISRMLK
jgi:transcriptional regulator with GAF, ATPase, and Fis domain